MTRGRLLQVSGAQDRRRILASRFLMRPLVPQGRRGLFRCVGHV